MVETSEKSGHANLENTAFLDLVAREFCIAQRSVAEIKKSLGKRYEGLTSQMVYRAIQCCARKNIIGYNPRRIADRQKTIYELFKTLKLKLRKDSVHVVDGSDPPSKLEQKDLPSDRSVPIRAAEIAFDLLREKWKEDSEDLQHFEDTGDEDDSRSIGIGLGPGIGTQQFSAAFGALLEQAEPMKLDLYALTGGAPADQPDVSPISFFNNIPQRMVKRKIGLFAPNVVKVDQWHNTKERPGIKEAMDERDDIRLYVTAMGDAADERDLLRRFLEEQRGYEGEEISATWEALLDAGYIGNVQYRPYSAEGPIEEIKSGYRVATLVELKDLVRDATTKDKDVILMARNKSGAALLPLFTQPRLRVFSKIVMDLSSADSLIEAARASGFTD